MHSALVLHAVHALHLRHIGKLRLMQLVGKLQIKGMETLQQKSTVLS